MNELPPMGCHISVLTGDHEDVKQAIRAPLVRFNAAFLEDRDETPLVVPLLDQSDAVIGGMYGRVAEDWLYIEVLVVPPELRGEGWGTKLVEAAELEALRLGCHGAWLGTFEFQARGFYARLGYSCFGELNDYPKGHSLYLMKKLLHSKAPSGDVL